MFNVTGFISSEQSGLTEAVVFVYNGSFEINYKMLCVVRNNAHRQSMQSSRFANSDSEENWKHLWETISFFLPLDMHVQNSFSYQDDYISQAENFIFMNRSSCFHQLGAMGYFSTKSIKPNRPIFQFQFSLVQFLPFMHATSNMHVRHLPSMIVTRSGLK